MNLIPWKQKERSAGLPASGFRSELDELLGTAFCTSNYRRPRKRLPSESP